MKLGEHLAKMIAANDCRYEQRFDAQEKAVAVQLAAHEKAVLKAEAATDSRFSGVNEFRAQLSDQARTFMPRAESDQAFRNLSEKIDNLTSRVDQRDSRGLGAHQMWGYVVGGIGMIVGITGIVIGVLSRFK